MISKLCKTSMVSLFSRVSSTRPRLRSLSLNRRIGGLEIDAEVQDEPLTISVVLCHTDL